jgi:hypothetical protein
MKLKEFLDRELLVNEKGKVYTKDNKKYKDENGQGHNLEVSDPQTIIDLIKTQLEEGEGRNLIEDIEKFK